MVLDRSVLDGKVDGFILDRLDLDRGQVRTVSALDLLSWNRLDLGFKLFYLFRRETAPDIARDIYRYDIRAQTLGSYSEIGNTDKNSFEKYLAAFDDTAKRIASEGFDPEASLIPVAADGTILNGAHRTAACIAATRAATVFDTGLDPIVCDHRYFRDRGTPEYAIQLAVRELVRHKPNSYVAFLWPSGRQALRATRAEFTNVVYETDLALTPHGAFNLLREIYRHMDWIGDRSDGFSGIKRKLGECFTNMAPVHIVVFHEDNFENVMTLKSRVREINGIGFSSIHITDTHAEARDAAELILCEIGRSFLNTADLDKFDWEVKLAAFVAESPAPAEDSAIDSGFVMELFGLRRANDIDALIDDAYLASAGLEVDMHDYDLHHHGTDKSSLIHDPRNHFVFRGRKFLTLDRIRTMKASRGEAKDKLDLRLINSIRDRSAGKALWLSVQMRAFHGYHRSRMAAHRRLRGLLDSLGLLEAVKAVLRRQRP